MGIDTNMIHNEKRLPISPNYDSAIYGLLPILFLIILYFYIGQRPKVEGSMDSTLGIWSLLLPRVLQNGVYAFKASTLLESGYNRFKERAFKLIRNDGDVIVLPTSLLDQLSALPSTIASPHSALEQDLLGPHTGLDLILESRMHHSIVQRKLTPRLPLLVPGLQEELIAAVEQYFPEFEQTSAYSWTKFQPYQVFAKVSARLAARALVGPELCKNETWLDISVNYTENLFQTIVVLRFFPQWTHTWLRYLLPTYWKGKRYLRAAKDLLGPIIQDLLDKNDRGEWTPANNIAESNVLCWLVDTAKGSDRDAEKLAHVEVLLALASVHTTLLRMVNVLYDITAASRHTTEIQEEILRVFDMEKGDWTYEAYGRLEKLDSILCESQRMSPPTILGLKRLFKESFTFADGTHIPKGSYVTMPIQAIENDPKNTSNPIEFDGLRNYRMRHGQNENEDRTGIRHRGVAKREDCLFSTPKPTVLNFGYGKTACPGRFFASITIKMVFVKLLSEYEFRFETGQIRPQNLMLHEFLFCWPWQWMEVRRKKEGMCPF